MVRADTMPASLIAKRSLPDLTAEELAAWMVSHGYNAAHAPRVLRELYEANGERSHPDARMPAGLKELLSATFSKEAASLAMRQVADDGTGKLLLRLGDGRETLSLARALCPVPAMVIPVVHMRAGPLDLIKSGYDDARIAA